MSSKNTEPKEINPVAQATTPGYRHHRIVPMLQEHEGKELHLPMVILNSREDAMVQANAYQDTLKLFNGKCPKLDEPSNWDQQLEAQRAAWIVFMSCRLPNDLTKRWFNNKEQVEDTYNWDELGILMNHYLDVRLSQPHLKSLDLSDPDSFQNMIDQIKKMGTDDSFFLNGFTTHSLNRLIKFLVAQLENLQSSNGSSGTP